jgi:hypothetical protein
MTAYRVMHASMYANDMKIATCVTAEIELHGNDEPLFSDGRQVGWADGAVTTSCTIEEIVPVQGTTFNFVAAMQNKQFIEMQFVLVDGASWIVDMRCMDRSYTSNARAGTLKGRANMQGFEPHFGRNRTALADQ